MNTGAAKHTIFTQIQDNSILRHPSNKTHVKGKCIYPNLRQPPKNKMSAKKKNWLLISYTWYTKHVRFYLPLPISITVSICTVTGFICLTLTPNISMLFTTIPQHVIISPIHYIGYTAILNTLHNYFW